MVRVSQGNMVFDQREDRDHIELVSEHSCKIRSNLRQIDIITSTYLFKPAELNMVLYAFSSNMRAKPNWHLSASRYSMGDLRKQEEKKRKKMFA